MAEYRPMLPTMDGQALLAKTQSGLCTVQFTRVATGSGSWVDDEDYISSTSLKNEQQSFDIASKSIVNERTVVLKAALTNAHFDGEGYAITEIGIFAADPDKGEILYAISVAVQGKTDWMPAYNGLAPSEYDASFYVEVSHASEVTLKYEEGTYALATDVDELKAALADIETDLGNVQQSVQQIVANGSTIATTEITIALDSWTYVDHDENAEEMDWDTEYQCRADYEDEQITEQSVPILALDRASCRIAAKAGLCPSIETLEGKLLIWAEQRPTADIAGTLTLVTASGEGTTSSGTTIVSGSVQLKPGGGLKFDDQGRLMLDAATLNDLDSLES